MAAHTDDDSLIRFNAVTKLYGKVLGVNDINLTLPAGAYGLLGPNGAGKSTLLNLLTGQLLPTRGTVRVLGQNPRNNPNLMRQIGYCPGFEGLYSSTTGLRWVSFLLEMHGISKITAETRARECLEMVGMREAQDRPISSYSRGMRQRTKLAQAIAHDPKILILDEPLSGLDPVGRAEMTGLLRQRLEAGGSLILASHVLHEIESITDSFLLISGGRLLASGTAEEVHELLFDLPVDVQIRCDNPRRLSALVMEHGLADSVSVTRGADGTDILHVATRRMADFSGHLPGWVANNELRIQEMRTSDGSLQSLFNSLMKIHRGEL